jgi:hypothetical protein
MSVRVWIILTLAVAFVSAYFTITRVQEALTERWLFDHGVDVKATYTLVNYNPGPNTHPRNESLPASIKFKLNGTEYTREIQLEPKPGAFAVVGKDIDIKVDPNNPDRFAETKELPPWSHELAVIAVLIPILVIVVILVLLKRRGVLRVWRDAPLAEATIVELRHTPVAPLSSVVRFTLADGPDKRIWTTLMPSSAKPEIGQRIWLICPAENPGRAIVAKLYIETTDELR